MRKYADLLSFIKTERIWLTIGGFYPTNQTKYKIWYKVSGSFILNLTLLYILLAFIHGFLNLSDVTVLSEIVTFLMTELAYVGKIVNLFYYKKNLILLEDMLQNPILTELESDEEEKLVKSNLKYSRIFTNIFKMNATLAASVHAIYPLIDRHPGSKHFLFLLWFPFDPYDFYVIIYFFEMLLLISSTWFDITLDALNILMMDLCATQFELLKSRLIRISSSFSKDQIVDNRIRFQKIRKCIIHHDYIYRCSELVKETYSVGEFCQVACSVMIICFGLFKMLVIPVKSMQFLMLASYTLTMVYQVSLYCCYGQKLLDASNTVTEACYMSQWNNCSLKIQKYLIMIMNRANIPVTLKAGGIFSLTLETLMTICTSSYSFFAILWQVYNTEDSAI